MKKQKKPVPSAEAEPVIKKQPLLKRLLFGPERPDLSELEAGSTTILDILSPTAIDTKSRDYIVVDGVFHAYLYITGYGYSTTVGSCWLAPLVEAGEGVNVSFSFTRQNREKILSKIAQTTMLNRSRMRDVGDTRQDYEELDSAITSGLYLKDVMNRQGEDFYYIFQLKMEGYSQQAIANYLSSEGVLPPAAYKQQQGLKYQSGFQAVGDNNAWSPIAVRAILENPIYIGTLVQGKRGTPNYKIKQMKLRSKEDWCIVEKNHAPIISEELFTSVQHLLSLDTRTSPSEEVVQPLAGMLYCADCGRAMCRRSVKRGNRTFYYYVCSTHKRSKLCSSHSISQTALEDVVLRAIQKQIEMVVDIDQLIHEIGQKSIQAAKHRQLDMTIEEKEKQITGQKEYRMRLLEAFHDDLISRTEYDMMRQRYTQQIDALQATLASLHERRQALEEGAADTRNWVAEYTKFRKLDKLTREMVAGLIRRITVSEGKQITIQFNYADELASYQQMIAAVAREVG